MPQNDAINGAKSTQPASKLSNTEGKLRSRANLIPFGKGPDPRRNLKGRPRSFDQARALAQAISHELLTKDGKKVTVAEAVLRSLALSKEPQALKIFLEYAFGPPPTKSEITGLETKPVLILHYAHERQNAEQN